MNEDFADEFTNLRQRTPHSRNGERYGHSHTGILNGESNTSSYDGKQKIKISIYRIKKCGAMSFGCAILFYVLYIIFFNIHQIYSINDWIANEVEKREEVPYYNIDSRNVNWMLKISQHNNLYNYSLLTNGDIQTIPMPIRLNWRDSGHIKLGIISYMWLGSKFNDDFIIANISPSIKAIKASMYKLRDEQNMDCVCALHLGFPINIILIKGQVLIGANIKERGKNKLSAEIEDELLDVDQTEITYPDYLLVEHSNLNGSKIRLKMSGTESLCVTYCLKMIRR